MIWFKRITACGCESTERLLESIILPDAVLIPLAIPHPRKGVTFINREFLHIGTETDPATGKVVHIYREVLPQKKRKGRQAGD